MNKQLSNRRAPPAGKKFTELIKGAQKEKQYVGSVNAARAVREKDRSSHQKERGGKRKNASVMGKKKIGKERTYGGMWQGSRERMQVRGKK